MKNYNQVLGTFDGILHWIILLLFLAAKATDSGGLETNFVRYAIPNTFIIVFITVP